MINQSIWNTLDLVQKHSQVRRAETTVLLLNLRGAKLFLMLAAVTLSLQASF